VALTSWERNNQNWGGVAVSLNPTFMGQFHKVTNDQNFKRLKEHGFGPEIIVSPKSKVNGIEFRNRLNPRLTS
jgi:hypothetical protein